MADDNVVRIKVTADDMTAAGFGEAVEGTDALAEASDELGAAMQKTADAAAELQAANQRLSDLEATGAADAQELAAATDEVAAATQRYAEASAEAAAAQAKQGEATAAAAAPADAEAASLDRVSGAQARVVAMQARASAAIAAQKDALAELDAANKAAADGTTASADAQVAALDRVMAADREAAVASRDLATAQDESAAASKEAGGVMATAGSHVKMALLGVAVGAGLAVKGAADYQAETERLVTSAGESAKNLELVRQGMLNLSSGTNTSLEDLSKGMYLVESAGFHAGDALTVLGAAAEGAKAENADLGTVSNALTSILNAYHMSASQSTAVTNQMLAAVGRGKMTMEDFSSALSAVLPIASSAHVSFDQVGGAIATMTAQGMSARQAAQDLSNMIRSMVSPSATASAEMRALGLNANEVSNDIGTEGLTGTLQTFTDAILKNTQGGDVLIGYMHEMTPAAQGLAREILAGSISTKDLRTAVQGLNPEQAKLISLFEASATSATGLKQTFDGAMSKMAGGATGLNVALMLGGKHMDTFEANTKAVGAAASGAGKNIDNWKAIQNEMNFQLGSAEKAIEAMGVQLGSALLPAVSAILKPISALAGLIARNKVAADAFAVVIGGVLAGALGVKLAGAFTSIATLISTTGTGLGMLAGKFGLVSTASEAAAVAQEAEAVATDGATGAMAAFDVAADANPIGALVLAIEAIIAALIALGIGIYEIIKHWRGLATAAVDTWHAIYAVVMWAWHGIEDVARPVISWLESAWHSVVNAAESAWHDITAGIGVAVHFIESIFEPIWHALILPFQIAKDIITGHVSAIKGQVAGAVSGIIHMFDQLTHDAEQAVEDLVNGVRDGWDMMVAAMEAAWNDAVSVAKDAWHLLVSVLTDAVNGAKDILHWFSELPGLFRQWFMDAVNGAWSVLMTMLHDLEGLPGKILSAIGNLGHLLWNAGEQIIQGLIQGIESAAGGLLGTVENLAKEVEGAFKGVLSILSPSRVFFEHGRNIVLGAKLGVEAEGPGLIESVRKLATQAAGAFSPRGAVSGIAGYGQGGAAGGYGEPQRIEVILSARPGADGAVVQAIMPYLRAEIRQVGGGGPNSVQLALGTGRAA